MKDLSLQEGVNNTDTDYLNGKIENDETLIGEGVNQDIVQFFQKLMDLASITPNDNFDNETNGYQLIQALQAFLNTGVNGVITEAVEIGAWDMDTDIGKNVSWTLPAGHEIVGAKAIIYYDGTTAYGFPLDLVQLGGASTTPIVAGGIQEYHAGSTNEFELRRTPSSFFDQAAFSGAVDNRGYILVSYIAVP